MQPEKTASLPFPHCSVLPAHSPQLPKAPPGLQLLPSHTHVLCRNIPILMESEAKLGKEFQISFSKRAERMQGYGG